MGRRAARELARSMGVEDDKRVRSTGKITDELTSTDRLMQRWAVSVNGGLPTEIWDDELIAKPPPLPEDMAVIVDQLVMKAPRRERTVLSLWYRSPQPTEVIVKRLNCSARTITLELNASLGYMRYHMLMTGEHWLWNAIGETEAGDLYDVLSKIA